MSGIHVYNRLKECHEGENNFKIFRGVSVLGNPYTDIKDRETKAQFVCRDREEALEKYSHYFDVMYNGNIDFRAAIDIIYDEYKNGRDVWLECYCAPKKCHGDIIAEKLQQRLIREKIENIKQEKK